MKFSLKVICKNRNRAVGAVAVAFYLCGIVKCEPVRGGYEDSLQNIGGYGAPYGSRDNNDYASEPANYDFQYEVFGGGNFFGHQESRRDQTAKGKYHVLLPDGRRQVVNYIADESGYHPTITYEVVANPFDGPSGGYGSGNGGYDSPKGSSGGYGSDNSLGGYSAPEQGGRYSSRIKRQFAVASPLKSGDDLVKIYKSEVNPEQRFRNRRRRFSPKKTYLIVYPNLSSSSFTGQEELLKLKPVE